MNTTGAEILAEYRNRSSVTDAISLEELIDNAIAAATESAKAEEVQEPFAYAVYEGKATKALLMYEKPTDEECSEHELSITRLYTRPQPVRELSEQDLKDVGCIVHGDGNVFATNVGVINRAILKAASQPAPPQPHQVLSPLGDSEFEKSASKQKFKLGDPVKKSKGSQWHGKVVGAYSTSLTPEGYAVESNTEKGSVQIYPASALELDQIVD